MVQQNLWNDGYIILKYDTGEIGQTRLRRFLNWLDKNGFEWTEPHLDLYEKHLQAQQLHASTIYQNVTQLRRHYMAILAHPEQYAQVPPEHRAEITRKILEQLGYEVASVNYEQLISGSDAYTSENMQVLRPPAAHQYRTTQLTAYIYWLDRIGGHWSKPDLLAYKEYLIKHSGDSLDIIGNAIHAVRRRYLELAEDEELLNTLPEDVHQDFLDNLRRKLGYLDQYPKRSEAERYMLEDDPVNQHYLKPVQVTELLNKPDRTTLVGLRDRALIGLALMTGIQQFEIAAVEVDHLRSDYEGQLAIFVPGSKNRDARCVPYDGEEWILDWIDEWLKAAKITGGAVFRGTYGNRDVLRPRPIAPETASDILARYPVTMHGSEIPLLIADLRATCSRRWYDNGLTLNEIERRLGTNYRPALMRMLGLRIRKAFRG